MKKHLKRQAVPKNWPVPRKGTTFVVKPRSKGLPLLVVLRDLMKIARNRKEVKIAISKKDILLCGKPANDERKNIELFDVLTIIPSKKSYRLTLSEKGKYKTEEISEKEATIKIAKIIGKKQIKGKKLQLNLNDGRNFLYKGKSSVNDSVLVDFSKKSISKVIPLNEGSKVLIVGGKHSGISGKIAKMFEESKMVEVESEKNKFRALIKQIMVLG